MITKKVQMESLRKWLLISELCGISFKRTREFTLCGLLLIFYEEQGRSANMLSALNFCNQ